MHNNVKQIQDDFNEIINYFGFEYWDDDAVMKKSINRKKVARLQDWIDAANNGVPEAQTILGWKHYFDGDVDLAAKWFRKASRQGFALGHCELGSCYFEGKGVVENVRKAVSLFTKAAEQGCKRAYWMWSEIVMAGGLEELAICRKYAQDGNIIAQCALADHLFTMADNPEKTNEAAKWYLKAAKKGHAPAMYGLGKCYATGCGVEKDLMKAEEWALKAKEANEPDVGELLQEIHRQQNSCKR